MVVVADTQIPLVSNVLRDHSLITASPFEINNALLRQTKAQALLVRSITHVSDELLQGTDVTFVGSATAGMDHIDSHLLCSPTVRVTGAPGCNANAVAEYVVIWLQHLSVPATSTIGIVGFGNVGQRLARYALQRGHRVLVNDPPLANMGYAFPWLVEYRSLDDLVQRSDVVSIHTPYTVDGPYATRDLFDAQTISTLHHGALLINAARGGIVDECALITRVQRNEISCVLDVFTSEPVPDVATIESARYCTPHIAGYSEAAKYQGARMVLKALKAQFSLNVVIPELSELTTRNTTAEEDARVIVEHPFRRDYIINPNARTFEESRRLTPLRAEHLQPPTWEMLHGNRS